MNSEVVQISVFSERNRAFWNANEILFRFLSVIMVTYFTIFNNQSVLHFF